ncbi:MAG: hypothetical protein P4L46_01220 [Fimbriimonas sp.]|nr:hypothetical protein [Fimbriimonas sp.]
MGSTSSQMSRLIPWRSVLSVLVTVWFVLYAILPLPATSYGIQCPTAPVQKVTAAVHDCCGRVVGAVSRAPRPGEKGFVQCRCAEKKTSVEKSNVPSKAPVFLCLAHLPAPGDLLPESVEPHPFATQMTILNRPPLTLPPA